MRAGMHQPRAHCGLSWLPPWCTDCPSCGMGCAFALLHLPYDLSQAALWKACWDSLALLVP